MISSVDSLTNNVMNQINSMTTQPEHSKLTRHLKSRATVLFGALPAELFAVAKNSLLNLPTTGVGALANGFVSLASKAVSLISSSQVLNKISEKLPNLSTFLQVVGRVIGYALGALATATVGIISPAANFKLHYHFKLVTDQQEIATKAALREKETYEARLKHKEQEYAARVAAAEAAQKQAEELQAVNNLATVAAIANAREADAQEEILSDIPAFFARAERPETPTSSQGLLNRVEDTMESYEDAISEGELEELILGTPFFVSTSSSQRTSAAVEEETSVTGSPTSIVAKEKLTEEARHSANKADKVRRNCLTWTTAKAATLFKATGLQWAASKVANGAFSVWKSSGAEKAWRFFIIDRIFKRTVNA